MTGSAHTTPTSFRDRTPATGTRLLACCSGGGHLKQLASIVGRLPHVDTVTWLTYENGLSREVLTGAGRDGDRVVYAPYAAPRDVPNLLRNARIARRLLNEERFDLAISTGAGIAVAVLPLAHAKGVRACFIESATRAMTPSMSGRILERTPGVELYTQNQGYGRRWRYIGSVHDQYERGPDRAVGDLRRVVVTLGTIAPYGFRRLVTRLLTVLPSDAEVLWQTGSTDLTGLPIEGRSRVPAAELEAAIREADVVVAHAGTGTAMTAFEHGRCPVLVPRRHRFNEHIDDHQVVTAEALAVRDLAVYSEVADLDLDTLRLAAGRSVVRVDRPSVLLL